MNNSMFLLWSQTSKLWDRTLHSCDWPAFQNKMDSIHFSAFSRKSSPPQPIRRHQPHSTSDACAATGGRDPVCEDQLCEEDHRGLQQLWGDGEAASLQLLGEPSVLLHRAQWTALAGKSPACVQSTFTQMGHPKSTEINLGRLYVCRWRTPTPTSWGPTWTCCSRFCWLRTPGRRTGQTHDPL